MLNDPSQIVQHHEASQMCSCLISVVNQFKGLNECESLSEGRSLV